MLDYLFTQTPIAFLTQNLWRDEAFSYLLAQEPISRIISLTVKDFSPPLYYILLHYWILIFGSSEVALRGLSFLFYVFTLYMAFEIMRYIFKYSRLFTFTLLILFILNPFLNYYAAEARMYMMVTFFVALSYFALWKPYKKAYVIAMTAALYTQYFAAFIYLVQWVPRFFLYFKTHYRKLHQLSTWKIFWNEFYPAIMPIALFLPWIWYILQSHNFSDNSFWIIVPPKIDIFYIPFLLFTGYERVFGQYYHEKAGYTMFHTQFTIILWISALLPLISIFLGRLKDGTTKSRYSNLIKIDVVLWAFFTPILIFALSFITQPLFHPRYYIFASVGFTVLLAMSFHYCWISKNIILKGIGIILFIIVLQWTWSFMKLNLKYRSKHKISPMISEIKSLIGPHDYVYTESELDYHLIQYYMKEKKDRVRIYHKTYEEIPAYVGKVLIPENDIAPNLPHYPSKAFVLFYSWYEIQTVL